jgi:hypothetical protein
MQVTQVCRDVAHMFAYGVDFTQSSYQDLVVNTLSAQLGLTKSGTDGHGVVILSKITLIDKTCDNTKPPCANTGYYVVTRRIIIGNSTIKSSAFAPSLSSMDGSGNVSQTNYLNSASARASASGASFASPITLPVGQFAYVGEMYVTSPKNGSWSTSGPPSVAARFIF